MLETKNTSRETSEKQKKSAFSMNIVTRRLWEKTWDKQSFATIQTMQLAVKSANFSGIHIIQDKQWNIRCVKRHTWSKCCLYRVYKKMYANAIDFQ